MIMAGQHEMRGPEDVSDAVKRQKLGCFMSWPMYKRDSSADVSSVSPSLD